MFQIRIGEQTLSVTGEEAVSFHQRFKGLMGKREIEHALLFRECSSVHMFFMKTAIDVMYLDEDYRILGGETLFPWKSFGMKKGCAHILELPQGIYRKSYERKRINFMDLDDEPKNNGCDDFLFLIKFDIETEKKILLKKIRMFTQIIRITKILILAVGVLFLAMGAFKYYDIWLLMGFSVITTTLFAVADHVTYIIPGANQKKIRNGIKLCDDLFWLSSWRYKLRTDTPPVLLYEIKTDEGYVSDCIAISREIYVPAENDPKQTISFFVSDNGYLEAELLIPCAPKAKNNIE